MRSIAVALGLAGLTASVSPVLALAQPNDPALWGVGIGLFDLFQDEGFQAGNLTVEWRGESLFWRVKPLVGLGLNTDGAVYAFGGIAVDLNLTDRIVVTPSFAPTLYLEGDSKDLGSWFEFRSGIELAYRFEDKSRVGVGLYHLSHAGIGHYNPGTEILSVYYAAPLPYVFGH